VGDPRQARRLHRCGRPGLSSAGSSGADGGSPLVARVVPDVTGLDKSFDYLVPDALASQVQIGSIVRVPLHGRRVGGFVVALGAASVAVERLKPITKVTGVGPAADIHELAAWASVRWAARRLRPFLVAASPPGAVVRLPPPRRSTMPVPGPVDAGAASMLASGGGVLRHPPTADELPVVLAACRLGSTLVVVPSIDRARVLAARLRRTGREVALVPDEWAAARAGVDVVIGARTAVWAPCADLAAVVVLDEHDEALQEERAPTWHARDVARERARRASVPALFVSPAPSVAVLASSPLARPSTADERAGWPLVEVVDRSRDAPWLTSLVSSALIRHLREPGRRVVCVLNTRGRAALVACRTCTALQRCESCEAAVSVGDDGVFRCRRCGLSRPVVCQACGATAMKNVRPGVSRLAEELEAAASRAVTAVSVDHDDDIGDTEIHVGTEAVLHRVRQADVVAFLDFDAELLAPRYRASEQAMSLLVRAARLVGPRAGGGRLLVQTTLPQHVVVRSALLADPGRLAADESRMRALLRFPPASALAVIDGAGADTWMPALRERGLEVLGPTDGRYLVRAEDWMTLGRAIVDVAPPKGARVRVAVDPPRI
jgi:primosomal protein N' (replication factor Y) (superfamily II helicase)